MIELSEEGTEPRLLYFSSDKGAGGVCATPRVRARGGELDLTKVLTKGRTTRRTDPVTCAPEYCADAQCL